MRVLHVSPYFAPAWVYGGPPRSILGLCRGLQSAGVEVDVVTTTANGRIDLAESAAQGDVIDGVRVHYVRRRSPRLFFNAGVRPVIQRLLATADLCHVHGLWNVPEWIATREARRHNIPYVLSPRGMLLDAARAHHGRRKRVLFRAMEARNVRSAARLHATSTAEADCLADFADPRRVVVAPNGVDLEDATRPRPSIRHTVGLASDARVVLFVGRIHPIKRLDLLAEAMVLVRKQYADARLVIAGPDEGGTLRTLSGVLESLDNGAMWIGEVDDERKWAWLHDADVLVCCSDSENFGMSVAEAMAAALPVVVTRSCPWPDVDKAGAGFWVTQDVRAIADAIIAVLSNSERARLMGQRGHELVTNAYSWPAVARLVVGCYSDILAERGVAGA